MTTRSAIFAAYLDRLILTENHIWRGGRSMIRRDSSTIPADRYDDLGSDNRDVVIRRTREQ